MAAGLSEKVAPIPPAIAETPPPQMPTGGLWQANASGGLSLAEDRRARRVGDLITIRLVERIQAEKSVSQDADRT
ncbi:MAG: flagellar basal body L-ring protein FlgH, partial [Sandaracinobacteroides sp.]